MATGTAVIPIALAANWIYALPSREGLLLVDAGPDYPSAWEELSAQLDVHGYRPEAVRVVVITHAHVDHCGLAARWQSMGAEVCGSAKEAEGFGLGLAIGWRNTELVLRFYAECGMPAEALERMRERWKPLPPGAISARVNNKRWPGLLNGTPFQPERLLRDGDEVRVGERCLRFVATPGHTPGDSVYYEEGSGVLFSGDHLLPRITPTTGLHFPTNRYEERMRSLPAYLRSLGRVRALGAMHLYPGHGEATAEVEGVAERTAGHHRRRQGQIIEMLRDGPLTPYQILRKSTRTCRRDGCGRGWRRLWGRSMRWWGKGRWGRCGRARGYRLRFRDA